MKDKLGTGRADWAGPGGTVPGVPPTSHTKNESPWGLWAGAQSLCPPPSSDSIKAQSKGASALLGVPQRVPQYCQACPHSAHSWGAAGSSLETELGVRVGGRSGCWVVAQLQAPQAWRTGGTRALRLWPPGSPQASRLLLSPGPWQEARVCLTVHLTAVSHSVCPGTAGPH